MTVAIGAWMSLHGWPTASASGIRASPVANAVIRVGTRRSVAARLTASRGIGDALAIHQLMDVGDQHEAVARGDAEQGDKADDGGHREHATGREDSDDPAEMSACCSAATSTAPGFC